ncbi:hypothetical protein L227DRAFT_261269 [Lentinus tigrinus ALCF2SS1-6]|uniref:Uncharacterized protein n=1 Tax=Lentinus tigrinus ALCF2SS1-6 TaxID=1328759 RepID=A0A5C2SLV1_9APHY|nr:hypothetical protein L227DRAFT_261269 [Lentinus tigrinus ALCF2SS1-6]
MNVKNMQIYPQDRDKVSTCSWIISIQCTLNYAVTLQPEMSELSLASVTISTEFVPSCAGILPDNVNPLRPLPLKQAHSGCQRSWLHPRWISMLSKPSWKSMDSVQTSYRSCGELESLIVQGCAPSEGSQNMGSIGWNESYWIVDWTSRLVCSCERDCEGSPRMIEDGISGLVRMRKRACCLDQVNVFPSAAALPFDCASATRRVFLTFCL